MSEEDEIDKKIEQFFWDADKDRSGTLSLAEVKAVLEKNGIELTQEQFNAKFATFDVNNDGVISFHEYLRAMDRSEEDVKKYAEIERVFRLFDKDNKGYITRLNISQMFRNSNRHLLNSELENIMKKVDTDRSGRIEMDEFITIFDNMK